MVIGTLKIIEESQIAREASRLRRFAVAFSTCLAHLAQLHCAGNNLRLSRYRVANAKVVYRRALYFINPR